MNTFLVILLIAAMIATVVALVRGIVSFLQASSAEARGEGGGPTAAQLKSNRMMQMRIFYQALAILIVVVILFAAGRT
ncbi:twin transmembrane helix small protein [uncultured Sphingomonas sp.]|uniref:twin transmembrane helix small protein n=1 Tax=uncultured Sphingomonas sp. TaxID=158754 RepID=UPI00374A3CCB